MQTYQLPDNVAEVVQANELVLLESTGGQAVLAGIDTSNGDFRVLVLGENAAGYVPVTDGAWPYESVPPIVFDVPAVAARAQTANRPVEFHRDQFPHEVRAATSFAFIQSVWKNAVREALVSYASVQVQQIEELMDQIAAAGGDIVALAEITATTLGSDVLAVIMSAFSEAMVEEMRREAASQAVEITITNEMVNKLTAQMQSRATATAEVLRRDLSNSAARAAIRLTSENVSTEELQGMVREHLEGLSDRYLEDQIGGALTAVQNDARLEIMSMHPARIYASELLDQNTCDPCNEFDGHEFASIEEARQMYPSGGYRDCLGGPRCRGTLVAVFAEESEPSV